MKDFEIISIKSDGKSYVVIPFVKLINGASGADENAAKLKITASDAELGRAVIKTFDYIKEKHKKGEFCTAIKNFPSWKKYEDVTIHLYDDGKTVLELDYKDEPYYSYQLIENREFHDITPEQLGAEIKKAYELVFSYANRQQAILFLSEKEGLKIAAMAQNNRGEFVIADYCERINPPYDSSTVCQTLNSVFEWAKNNPLDKRSSKERKDNPPWREFTRFKSWRGFCCDNMSIYVLRPDNGSLVFVPSRRSTSCGSSFAHYSVHQTTLHAGASADEVFEYMLAAFEKSKELSQED